MKEIPQSSRGEGDYTPFHKKEQESVSRQKQSCTCERKYGLLLLLFFSRICFVLLLYKIYK